MKSFAIGSPVNVIEIIDNFDTPEPIAKLFKICFPLPSREGVGGRVKLQHDDVMATFPPPPYQVRGRL